MTALRDRFDALAIRTIGTGRDTWDRLDAGYADLSRAYHDWTHIAAMLAGLEEARVDPEFAGADIDAVELAVFFHDAIYDPLRTDNEAASAAAFGDEIGSDAAIGAEGVERVRALILATADHRASADTATQLLLDLDLAILGADPERYAAYVSAVRREYAHVEDSIWRLGRGAVLARFLGRDAIFQSAFHRERLEGSARRNLQTEMSSLRG